MRLKAASSDDSGSCIVCSRREVLLHTCGFSYTYICVKIGICSVCYALNL